MAGVEIGVRREAVSAVHLVPAGIEALQPVPVPVLVRIGVTERRELEGEHIVLVRQRHGLDVWDRFLECRFSADAHRPVEDGEVRDDDGRHVRVVADVLREERGDPIAAAEEQLSIPPVLRATPLVLVARQPVGRVVVSERLRPRIETGDPLLAADPQPDLRRRRAGPQIVARQAIQLRVARECFMLAVEPVQAQPRRQPECSGVVFVNGADAASLEAVEGHPDGACS